MGNSVPSNWSDPELVGVSAVEHYAYCPRQCALIYVEKVFDENIFTLRGTLAHDRADQEISREEDGVRVERALPIFCDALGVYGKADVVEFHPDDSIVPVEYKIGPRKESAPAALQLCAQAMCLEEMFGRPVVRGAVYHVSSRHRREVEITEELRQRVRKLVEEVRAMLVSATVPPAANDARCENCSLIDACVPSAAEQFSNLRLESGLFQPRDCEVVE